MSERSSQLCFLCNPHSEGPRPPTLTVTSQQLLYVTVMHGLGAMLISGGINFAIATGMYRCSRCIACHF